MEVPAVGATRYDGPLVTKCLARRKAVSVTKQCAKQAILPFRALGQDCSGHILGASPIAQMGEDMGLPPSSPQPTSQVLLQGLPRATLVPTSAFHPPSPPALFLTFFSSSLYGREKIMSKVNSKDEQGCALVVTLLGNSSE